MGREARCAARVGGHDVQVRAHLESDRLELRGDVRLDIPLRSVTDAAAEDGWLRLTLAGEPGGVELKIGADATRWVRPILHPPSLLDKLGIKDGMSVALLDVVDEAFASELAARSAVAHTGDPEAADVVLVGVESEERLAVLADLRRRVRPDAAVWVVRPKGPRGVPERAVMEAGLAAGFVDVKVARFSATHTAEKFVIRLADRPR